MELKIPFVLVAAVALLASCSLKFGSREEARNAQLEFLEGSKKIVVINVPTDEEVETKVFFWMLERKTSCREAKRRLAVGEAREATYGPLQFYVPGDSEFVEMSCPPKAPTSFTKEGLTEREIVNTRDCNHEKETRSYVCKEWKFFGNEIIKDKWTELKPAYSYFRY